VSQVEGWSDEAASHYLRVANTLVPDREDILAIVADLATAFVSSECRILDLGSGSGDVAAEILKRRPHASVLLADFSGEMIRLARERFHDFPGAQVVRHDLNSGVPDGLRHGEFHAVVSCFALHHVEPSERKKLYRDVRRVLRSDGLFVAGDRFIGEDPTIAEWEHERWVGWMASRIREDLGMETTVDEVRETQAETDQRLRDRPGTIWDMRRDLLDAGFRHVDCLFKTQIVGVLAASGSRG